MKKRNLGDGHLENGGVVGHDAIANTNTEIDLLTSSDAHIYMHEKMRTGHHRMIF
jgi:hypothetical protein